MTEPSPVRVNHNFALLSRAASAGGALLDAETRVILSIDAAGLLAKNDGGEREGDESCFGEHCGSRKTLEGKTDGELTAQTVELLYPVRRNAPHSAKARMLVVKRAQHLLVANNTRCCPGCVAVEVQASVLKL